MPNGQWPAEFDGGYLFADAGSGNMWLRHANGSIDYNAPFATGVGGIADMAFVDDGCSIALYYTLTGGAVRKITTPPGRVRGPRRAGVHRRSTRHSGPRHAPAAAGAKPIRAGTTRYQLMGVDPAVTKAVW